MLIIYNFLSSIFFSIISVINILIYKYKAYQKATYFIYLNDNTEIENRSIHYLKHIKLNQTLNFVRSNSDLLNLKLIMKIPNIVFFSKIEYLIKFFDKIKFIKNSNVLLEKFLEFIFSYLNIKKFLSIDDYRLIEIFDRVCQKKKVFSIFYMHGRFSVSQKFLANIKPNIYLVWSEYFKNKLLKINNKIDSNQIIVTGNPNLKKKILNNKKTNILFIYEDNMNLKRIIDITKKFKDKKNKFYFKNKPGYIISNKYFLTFNKNNIKIIDHMNFRDIVIKYNIGFLIAFDSTMLIESLYYNLIPIKLLSKKNISQDLVNEKLIFKADKDEDLLKIFNNLKKYKKKVLINKKKVWENKLGLISRKLLLNKTFSN